MVRINEDRLMEILVVGEPSHPRGGGEYRVAANGEPSALPGTGGICYNVRVGDPVLGFEADHLEPAVSMKHSDKLCNNGLNSLACVGNQAIVMDGPAEGSKGVVTGKHGGIEHVFADFEPKVLKKLRYGNKIGVVAQGLGMKLLDLPEVKIMNAGPKLVKKMKLTIKGGKLRVKVAKLVPACIMGSGLGSNNPNRGDYDIQMFDESVVEEYGLQDLRLGDIVALIDADSTYGRIYMRGAVTIGIISHGQCHTAGHGPGVTSLFASTTGAIEPTVDKKANIATILGLREL